MLIKYSYFREDSAVVALYLSKQYDVLVKMILQQTFGFTIICRDKEEIIKPPFKYDKGKFYPVIGTYDTNEINMDLLCYEMSKLMYV